MVQHKWGLHKELDKINHCKLAIKQMILKQAITADKPQVFTMVGRTLRVVDRFIHKFTDIRVEGW